MTPGEEVPLYLHSTLGDVEITAYRLGWYGGTGGRRVWSAPARVRVGAQPAPSIAADHGCADERRQRRSGSGNGCDHQRTA